MKSTKKLFAILTLMMFMMTLLPMAAFGAAVTTFTTTSGNATAGAAYAFTATLRPATALAAGDTITVTLPTGFSIADAAAGQALAGGTVNLVQAGATLAGTTWAAASNVITISASGADAILNSADATLTVNVTASTIAASHNFSLVTTQDTTVKTAAVTVIAAGENQFSSIVEMNKTSLAADGSATVKFTVYGYDAFNNVVPNPSFTVASNRGATDTIATYDAAKYTQTVGGASDARAEEFTGTASDGKVVFTVKSNVPGVAKIGIANSDNGAGTSIVDYMDGVALATGSTVKPVAVKDVTFTAASANSVIKAADATTSDNTAVTGTLGTSASPWASATGTINGNMVDYYELSFKVVASNLAPVGNQEVTFTASSSNITLSTGTATTDAAGVAKVKVNAKKPGTYSVKATAGDKSFSQYMTFAANDIYDIELITDNNQKIAKDAPFTLKFKLKDVNGNQVKPTFGGVIAGNAVSNTTINLATGALALSVEATTRPTDSSMDEKIATATGAGAGNGSVTDYAFSVTTEGYLQMKIFGGEINKEGAHAVKVYLTSGKYVMVNFDVAKQGTATQLTLKYGQNSVAISTGIGDATVKRVDAAGVAKELTAAEIASDIVFTASDVRKLTAAGIANTGLVGGIGSFTTINDEKYAGEFVITAVDTNKNLTASFTMELAKTSNGITLTPAAATTQVGDDAVVTMQIVDVEGKSVALGSGVTGATVDYYVTTKPAGAIISTSTPSTILKDVQETGKADLKLQSNVAGEVKVQVVLTTTGVVKTFTKDVTINFGAPKVVVGAKQVTMFIGATGFMKDGVAGVTDVAPFIQDGRTFVAVRPIADSFGAEIGWDEATQTVTLTRSDMTVTIVIGSNTITVVNAGVTSTVTADVAAMIKDGRTVLPFRAVGEAFGATVSYDAATQSVSYQQ